MRVDQLEQTFHYRYWREDLALVRGLGLHWLRYGPPYYRIHTGPDQYDWEFTDLVFAEMRRLGIVPIADLCHFGVPDWVGDFQNPDWPQLFGRFARAFAERFPWVRFYTPVNEIYVCAKLSTLAGFWNERLWGDHRAFVGPQAPLPRQSAGYRGDPEGAAGCRLHPERERRVLPPRRDRPGYRRPRVLGEPGAISLVRFPLCRATCRRRPPLPAGQWPDARGIHLVHGHDLGDRIVMGNDFYERNEQLVAPGGEIRPAGEVSVGRSSPASISIATAVP